MLGILGVNLNAWLQYYLTELNIYLFVWISQDSWFYLAKRNGTMSMELLIHKCSNWSQTESPNVSNKNKYVDILNSIKECTKQGSVSKAWYGKVLYCTCLGFSYCFCGKYSDRNNLVGVILFPLTVQGHNPSLQEQPQWQKLEAAGHIWTYNLKKGQRNKCMAACWLLCSPFPRT